MFNDGSSIISEVIIHKDVRKIDNVDEYFEMDFCLSEIKSNNYKRIGLQFPNYLLKYSQPLFHSFQSKMKDRTFYIMGNSPSSGVDLSVAKLMNMDLIIVFGENSCRHIGEVKILKETNIHVLHVFGNSCGCNRSQESLDIHKVIQNLKRQDKQNVPLLVVFNPIFHQQASNYTFNKEENIFFMKKIKRTERQENLLTFNGFCFDLDDIKNSSSSSSSSLNCQLLLIDDQKELTNHNNSIFNHFFLSFYGQKENEQRAHKFHFSQILKHHVDCSSSSSTTNEKEVEFEIINEKELCGTYRKLFQRRYYFMNECQLHQVYGIIVNFGEENEFLLHLVKEFLTFFGKKFFIFSIGSVLNPPKLANFHEEIDAWICFKCECFLIHHLLNRETNEEYFKPLLTPFELFKGFCGLEEWKGDYLMNIQDWIQLYSNFLKEQKNDINDETEKKGFYSFIKGEMMNKEIAQDENDDEKEEEFEILERRQWRGIEKSDTEKNEKPEKMFEGLNGIGEVYKSEKKN